MSTRSVIPVIICLFIISLSSCKKTEEIMIEGNTPPPDPTLANSIREGFINKSYISLLGRKPNDIEYQNAIAIVSSNENFTAGKRGQVIDQILVNQEFYVREFIIAKAELLNGIDTSEINEQIFVFNIFLQNSDFESLWPLLIAENLRLQKLYDIPENLVSNEISIREMHRRLIDNYFYDQINMGALNFVIATFQQFLLRNPTQAEAEQAVRMIEGFNSTLFLQIGENRADFNEIFFDSSPYYEGQVKLLFNRFLFRLPNSEEMSNFTSSYKTSQDYKTLIKNILTLDEYAGL